MMRAFPGEVARRVTLAAMRAQAATRLGRSTFRLLASTQRPTRLPMSVPVELFGLRFPSPVGLGPGIDVSAFALPLWPHLGLGFLEVGPVSVEERAGAPGTAAVCLKRFHAIVTSDQAGCPSAADVGRRVATARALEPLRSGGIPIGVALREPSVLDALAQLPSTTSFVTLPWSSALEPGLLARIRSSTSTPLLLRVPLGGSLSNANVLSALHDAVQTGIDGCVVGSGSRSDLLPDGWLHGPRIKQAALMLTAQVTEQFGERLPIIGAGGIFSPDDALEFLQAGARLVQLYEGLVYAGPGLPKRILRELESDSRQ